MSRSEATPRPRKSWAPSITLYGAATALCAALLLTVFDEGGVLMHWTPYSATLLLLAFPALVGELRYWPRTVLAAFGSLMLLTFLSLLYAQVRSYFPEVLIVEVGLFLVAAAAAHLTRTRPRLIYVLFAAVAVVWTADALRSWYTPLAHGQQRLLSPLGEWNSSAALYGGLAMFALVLAITTLKNKSACALAALGGLGLSALWLTGSRGAILVFVAVSPVALWIAKPSPRRFVAVASLATVVAIVASMALSLSAPAETKNGVVLIPDSVVNSTTNSTGALGRSQSATGDFKLRVEYWETALKITSIRPLLGMGPGSWQDVSWRYVTPSEDLPTAAHDYVLETSAEQGALAALAILVLLGALYVAVFRSRKKIPLQSPLRPLAMAAGAGFLFITTHSFIDFDNRWPVVMWLGAAFIGIVAASYPRVKSQESHPALLIPVVLSLFLLVAGCVYGSIGSTVLARPLGKNISFDADASINLAEFYLGYHVKDGAHTPLAGAALDAIEGSLSYNPGDPRLGIEAYVAHYYAKQIPAEELDYAILHQKLNPWIQGITDAATAFYYRGDYADEISVDVYGAKVGTANPGWDPTGLSTVYFYADELRALDKEKECNSAIVSVRNTMETYLHDATTPTVAKKVGKDYLAEVTRVCPGLLN